MSEHELQSLEDELAQRRKNHKKLSEQARMEIEKLQEEMEDIGREIKGEAQYEVDVELEIRDLQAGEDRRSSNASQSTNQCCSSPTIVEQFVAMGAK